MTDAWDRLPDESPQALSAFQLYLHLGPTRSVQKAWELRRQELGKPPPHTRPPGSWTSWSTRYDWINRAALWDDNNARIQAEAIENAGRERALENAETEWNAGTQLLAKALDILRLPTTRQRVTREQRDENGVVVTQHITIEPINFRLADSARLAEMGSRLQRRATGKPINNDNAPEGQDDEQDFRPFGISIHAPDGTIEDDDLLN